MSFTLSSIGWIYHFQMGHITKAPVIRSRIKCCFVVRIESDIRTHQIPTDHCRTGLSFHQRMANNVNKRAELTCKLGQALYGSSIDQSPSNIDKKTGCIVSTFSSACDRMWTSAGQMTNQMFEMMKSTISPWLMMSASYRPLLLSGIESNGNG